MSYIRFSSQPSPLGGYVFSHSQVRQVLKQTKLQRPRRFQGSGTGVPPVRIVQPTHGRDARATTVPKPDSQNPTLNTYLPWGEGELFSSRKRIQTRRLTTARCALFPLPEGAGQGEGKRHALDS